ncbi:MAG: hypothetical protein LBR83_03900 [Clostridiales bacterium]|jgi:hypothetical protein|nr:hypothetical protein [Clostridiales bacterium]
MRKFKLNRIGIPPITLTVLFLLSSVPLPAHGESALSTWDVEAASALAGERDKKPYTFMVYMNGSDLESESGAATDDLIEILESGLEAENANVVLFTGGANRWQNGVVPNNQCALWEISDGWLEEITGIGEVNMGDASTLAGFIRFGTENFPAEKYALILWDHGGGAIAGYGQDEKFIDGNLLLSDMRRAFESAGLKENKLEVLGFDSCLMATVEMAVVASDYARYMVASEDLEPGGGWDYGFLSALNGNPRIGGEALGKIIVDRFTEFFSGSDDEILSLSVTELSGARRVMDAMGQLMARCSGNLSAGSVASFRTLAGKRSRTKTFGEGSPRDNECDMVDAGDMAVKLRDLFPEEASEVLAALENCVVYNRHNSDADLKGLSAYYIYGGKETGGEALTIYASMGMNARYTEYLNRFFKALTGSKNRVTRAVKKSGAVAPSPPSPGETVCREAALWREVPGGERYRMVGLQTDTGEPFENLRWAKLLGNHVCLFPVSRSRGHFDCAIPAEINGRDGDIIVSFSPRNPQGIVKGARYSEGVIVQKGFVPLTPEDEIALYYFEKTAESGEWVKGEIFSVKNNGGSVFLEWQPAGENDFFGSRVTDVRLAVYYSPPRRAAAEQPCFASGFATTQ